MPSERDMPCDQRASHSVHVGVGGMHLVDYQQAAYKGGTAQRSVLDA
jgi:hypothetical protein